MSNSQQKQHILVMGLVDPSTNPRPQRLIKLFKDIGHCVSVAGFEPKAMPDVDFYHTFKKPSSELIPKITRKLIRLVQLIFKHDAFDEKLDDLRWGFSDILPDMQNTEYDYIVVEDIHLLPLAFKIKGSAHIVFDAREYHPREFECSFLWRLTEQKHRIALCESYLKRCDTVVTVSKGLQQQYEKEFGVSPLLFRSMSYFTDFEPQATQAQSLRLVHHGIANPDRKLENMIDLVEMLDERFTLDFYLNGNPRYIERLKKRTHGMPRVKFHDAVPYEQIIPTLNRYDLGLCFFYPTTFNLKHCLPNKLFEFIQGRLAVIAGPSPDIQEVIETHSCGFVSPDYDLRVTANMINALTTEDIDMAKAKSHEAAQILCFEQESQALLEHLGIPTDLKNAA